MISSDGGGRNLDSRWVIPGLLKGFLLRFPVESHEVRSKIEQSPGLQPAQEQRQGFLRPSIQRPVRCPAAVQIALMAQVVPVF